MQKERWTQKQKSMSASRKHAIHPKRRWRVGRMGARLLLSLLFIGSFYLSCFPWGRASLRSFFMLPALIETSSFAPLKLFGAPVRFSRTTLSSRNGPVFLDTYEPAAALPLVPGKRAALINVVGVGDNRDASQLVNLSRSFAQEGIVVVNVATPTLFDFMISPQDSEAVVQAFQTLVSRDDVDPKRIGIIGFSAGATLACLAAADPRIRDQLAFITLFGGYFDATTLLRIFGQRGFTVDGRFHPWQPYYVSTQVLANAFKDLVTADENSLFQQAFIQYGTPLSPAEQQRLSPTVLAAYHLLAGDEPEQVEQHMATLTPQMRLRLHELSPASVIDRIHTPIYLLHDRNDQFIPFTQSRDFAAALARLHHNYDLAEFGIFQHVEVRVGNNLGQLVGDGAELLRILNKVLIIAS